MFSYNNVHLQNCRTLEFRVEQDRDPSGTDSLWNKYTIRVRGFATGSAGLYPVAGSAGADSAFTLNQLQDKLAKPRGPLTYSIGSTILVNHPGGGLDAHLGPEPMPGMVAHEVSSGVFMVEFGIVCRLVKCDNVCEDRDPVVSLRWSQTESFDENWYSRLSTNGRLIVRSDLLKSADSFRPLATPPLLADYKRVVARYTLSMDGTALDFTFEDQEVDRLPPAPATKARGSLTIHSPSPGYNRTGQVDIHLEGPKGTSRKQLLIRALQMAYSKLQSERFLTEPSVIIWGTFKEDLFEPVVDVGMQARLTPLVASGFLSAVVGPIIGQIVGGDQTPAPDCMRSVGQLPLGVGVGQPGLTQPVRKRLAGLLAAAFRDPCACLTAETSLDTDKAGSTFTPGNSEFGTELRNAEATIMQTELRTFPASGQIVTDTAPYDIYEIESSYGWDTGKVQLPATGVGPRPFATAIASAHGGMMTLTVTWVAGRTGRKPVYPNPESRDANYVFLRGGIAAAGVVPSADAAAATYLLSGYYQYGIVDPSGVDLSAPTAPFLGQPFVDTALSALRHASGFIGTLRTGDNVLVGGGSFSGDPPNDTGLGFGNLPPAGLPIGGWVDLSGTGGQIFDGPKVNP